MPVSIHIHIHNVHVPVYVFIGQALQPHVSEVEYVLSILPVAMPDEH